MNNNVRLTWFNSHWIRYSHFAKAQSSIMAIRLQQGALIEMFEDALTRPF